MTERRSDNKPAFQLKRRPSAGGDARAWTGVLVRQIAEKGLEIGQTIFFLL
jgi:hypothetical protein